MLTQQVGLTWQAPPPAPLPQGPELSEIYDTEFESLACAAYAADYTNFGFKLIRVLGGDRVWAFLQDREQGAGTLIVTQLHAHISIPQCPRDKSQCL